MDLVRCLAVISLLASGCVTRSQSGQSTIIQARHAAEFGCASSEVRVDTVQHSYNSGVGTFAAEGCGARAIYVCERDVCVRDSEPR